MDYEICKDELEALAGYFEANGSSRNEATTRLQLIDRLLFDCLGWDQNDCICEQSHAGRYADYTFTPERRVLIIEAKREGNYFELPAGTKKREYRITTLSHDYPDLRDAIKQAAGYCQKRGVRLGVVCNGHQLVAFLAARTDGVPPLEGRAIVFPSYDEMRENFLQLWNFLSKAGIREGNLRRRLSSIDTSPIPPKLSAKIHDYPGQKGRNPFQMELNILTELVLEDAMKNPSLKDRFLSECYCQSGALSQYATISKTILRTRYEALFSEVNSGPTLVPAVEKTGLASDLAVEGFSRRPILLVGDVGVGKTTFIRYLINIEAPNVFEDALTFYIDLGAQGTLSSDLRVFILEEIKKQLREEHDVDIDERNFVRGVYNRELQRFRRGIYGDLIETDPTRYTLKELNFLEGKIKSRDRHLKASLNHISRGRKKQIVIFIDNADQRDDETQQTAFIIAQELAENWPATIFVALRPETFHRSMRTGTLTGYHPKAFSISPPRIDEVIGRRLDFGLKLSTGRISIPTLGQISSRLVSLTAILKAFQESTYRNSDLHEAIDNISGGNVRRALDYVKQFFGSGHVDTGKIVDIYTTQGSYLVPLHEFLRAITFGDAKYYDPSRSPISNMFDVSQNDPKEHFLLPLLLGSLLYQENSGKAGFVEIGSLYQSLQNYGYTAKQIDRAIQRGYNGRLFSTPSRVGPTETPDTSSTLRITTVGAYHLRRLVSLFTYVDAITVDTPILIRQYRERIKDVESIHDRLRRASKFREYLDQQWRESDLTSEVFDWRIESQHLKEDISDIEQRIV